MSGVGKGIATASIGRILKDYGYRVSAVKIDPYINLDAGTMNPTEHGEVFVTEDGMECDQDIGNYERFLGEPIFRPSYMTTGIVYKSVIDKERNLEYGGKCVEVVPHIPLEVISRLKNAAKIGKADFVLVEIGGTVGEYQNILFLEATRMMKLEAPENVITIMVGYLPIPGTLGEMKTKPLQYAVRTLNSSGLQPDFIIARSSKALDDIRRKKISMFCNVPLENIISAPDVGSVYQVPIDFEKDKLGLRILKKFNLRPRKNKYSQWKKMVMRYQNGRGKIRIGMVGKYFSSGQFVLADSYISVIEAIKHAAWSQGLNPEIEWLDAEEFEKNQVSIKKLKRFHGVIVPGGFGSRGIEGKIKAIKYLREYKIPFLGLCYGMQLAVIEFARNACGLKGAHTTEVNPKTPYPVIDVMDEQRALISEKRNLGGSMRLGAYDCRLDKESKSYALYRQENISERHRHRYEVNNTYRDQLEEKGMRIAGINSQRDLVEIIELPDHPFFAGTQFHPEFKSNPLNPHPLFTGLIKASKK